MFCLPKTVQYIYFMVNVIYNKYIYIVKYTVPKYDDIHTGWILVRILTLRLLKPPSIYN